MVNLTTSNSRYQHFALFQDLTTLFVNTNMPLIPSVSGVYLITQTLPSLDIYVPMHLIHLTNIGKSVSTINEAYNSISWAYRLAEVKDPCKSDLVFTVKEGAHSLICHLTVKKER